MALNYFLKGLKLLDSILHHSLLKVLFHKKRKKKKSNCICVGCIHVRFDMALNFHLCIPRSTTK